MPNQANTHVVRLDDGREVCFSYGVPVAAYIPAPLKLSHHGYIYTDRRYSKTTSGHMNRYAGKDHAIEVTDAVLRRLILPLTGETR